MAALTDLVTWMDEQSQPHIVWYVKRLAANDTLASGGHQGGPYISRDFLLDVFPSLNRKDAENPDCRFELRIDSHADVREVRAVYYNNTFRGGTRNEARLTNFGGSNSPLLDADSTGALVVFAFHRIDGADTLICHVWVCDHEIEADLVEERIGAIEPGKWRVWSMNGETPRLFAPLSAYPSCWLEIPEIPTLWLDRFPEPVDILEKAVGFCPDNGSSPDVRLMRRRECEFEIFRSIEQAVELPVIQQGFVTIDDFIARAQTILQRRKSRSGLSLERHIRKIFIEEQLREGTDFSCQPESDPGKRPDFLFPSQAAYRDKHFPVNRLRMLAVKTTCKDRWRQILNEADRIKEKHLLTLQEGVSEGQFREMTESGIRLVVPEQLKNAYPKAIQHHLQTLESFIGDIRLLSLEPTLPGVQSITGNDKNP